MRLQTVALLALLLASAHAWDGWTTFISHQCNGDFVIFPNDPMIRVSTSGATVADRALETLVEMLRERVECECGSVDDEQIMLSADPFTALLNLLDANPRRPSSNNCQTRSFPRDFYMLDIFSANFPSTCTLQSWLEDGTCLMTMPLQDLHLDLRVSIRRCEDVELPWKTPHIPAFSLDCDGPGCRDLASFCKNSYCASGMTCSDYLNTSNPDFPSDVFNALRSYDIFDYYQTVAPGCYQESGASSPRTPANDLFSALMTYVNKNLFESPFNQDILQICGLEELANVGNGYLEEFTGSHWQVSRNYSGTLQCWQPADYPEYGSYTPRRYTLNQTALLSWDGILDSGEDIRARLAQPPEQRAVPPATRLAELDVDGRLMINLFGLQQYIGIEAAVPFIEFIEDLLFRATKCETSPELLLEAFRARFGVISPLLHLLQFDAYSLFEYAYATFPDYADYRYILYRYIKDTVMNLPDSFSFYQYLDNGIIAVDWTGLDSVMQMDLRIRLTIEARGGCVACENSTSSLPISTVDCLGADCTSFFGGFKPCSTNLDCPTTKYGRMSCNNVIALLDEHLLTNMAADDWFDYYFSTDNIDKSNVCYNVPFDQRSSDYDQRCSGPTSFWTTVTSFAHSVFGGIYKDSPPASDNIGSFCIPHSGVFDPDMWSSWSDTLMSSDNVDGRMLMFINYLKNVPL